MLYYTAPMSIDIPLSYSHILNRDVGQYKNNVKFIRNLEYLTLTSLDGKANKQVGDIIREINDVCHIYTGEAVFTSNNGHLTITAQEGTIFYITSIDTERRIIHLFVERGYLFIKLNNTQEDQNEVIINTPGGYASIRGTEISVSVNPNRVVLTAIENNITLQDSTILNQGFSNLIYPDSSIIQPIEENYSILIRELSIDENRFLLKGKISPLNSLIIEGEYVEVNKEGYFDSYIPRQGLSNPSLTIITPLNTKIKYRLGENGIIQDTSR